MMPASDNSGLVVRGLTTTFETARGQAIAAADIDFDVAPGNHPMGRQPVSQLQIMRRVLMHEAKAQALAAGGNHTGQGGPGGRWIERVRSALPLHLRP